MSIDPLKGTSYEGFVGVIDDLGIHVNLPPETMRKMSEDSERDRMFNAAQSVGCMSDFLRYDSGQITRNDLMKIVVDKINSRG